MALSMATARAFSARLCGVGSGVWGDSVMASSWLRFFHSGDAGCGLRGLRRLGCPLFSVNLCAAPSPIHSGPARGGSESAIAPQLHIDLNVAFIVAKVQTSQDTPVPNQLWRVMHGAFPFDCQKQQRLTRLPSAHGSRLVRIVCSRGPSQARRKWVMRFSQKVSIFALASSGSRTSTAWCRSLLVALAHVQVGPDSRQSFGRWPWALIY